MLGRMQLGHRSVLRGSDRLPRRLRRLHHHRTFSRALRSGVFRCVLDPRLAATSLNSVIATASGSTTHSGVASALAQVAVTAVAIASGACLSTKVDFLWPKQEDQPESLVLDGVDVTGYPIFAAAKVQKAIAFARRAHSGQLRKTGEPYLSHCVHTGKILAALVPAEGERAINTVVAGILHDVIDDAGENLQNVQDEFGEDVAKLVSSVSRLSYINQLLRRHRRTNVTRDFLSAKEANNLRVMLLGMVDDPRVVLIKLADRLHNMRTIYALPFSKARAVAEETLAIWCSLASRLGVWAVKAELEDLSFAVLQPHTFRQMRAELAAMWSQSDRPRSSRRMTSATGVLVPLNDNIVLQNHTERPVATDDDEIPMKDLLQAVLPFDLLLDRRKRSQFATTVNRTSGVSETPKVVSDAGIALASLLICEEALEKELFISIPYIPGMEVTLSSRLKSLYSIYCKMKRKGVSIRQVYDARALRVVVGDKNGSLHGAAVKCCYSLLNMVHRLWTPIDGEFDDYIVNPKPSGYQSLHTAVQGPDCSPLEVQIRTQRMHEYAEFGLAAHWLYKEAESKGAPFLYSPDASPSSSEIATLDPETAIQNEGYQKMNPVKVGHPVLRVDGSHLLAAVIISVENNGNELLVAVGFGLSASEVLVDRRSKLQRKWWEAYANLYKKASDEWWFAPGHGDWCTCLERYKLCRDGIYHKLDQFQRSLSTFIQVIDLTAEEEAEYWRAICSINEGKPVTLETSDAYRIEKPSFTIAGPLEAGINSKVHLLRTMLKWEEQMHHEGVFGQTKQRAYSYGGLRSNTVMLDEVAIICWPNGEIMRMRSGSTAADVAARAGVEGKMVFINGQLVLPDTELRDGDIVEVRT
ncbi:uncharacterized protein LOC116265135 [Nymphaea colorata]|nr:uncharacterized protein LOC116265135 [Nymphaea colorata]